jgi:head-tail adaptor
MRAGILNKRIKIFSVIKTRDNNNSEVIVENLLLSGWTGVRTVKLDKLVENDGIINSEILQFDMRYRNTITSDCIIEYKTNRYNILTNEPLGNNEMIRLIASKDTR